MIKFEKIEAGMILAKIVRVKMGNTTMSRRAVDEVRIIEIFGPTEQDPYRRYAIVSCNGNRQETWNARRLERLYRRDSPTVKKVDEENMVRWGLR